MVILLAASAYPAHDPLKRVMALYKMHRYEDAATLLRSSLGSVEAGRQGIAHLSLGLVYLKNAELYRELYRTSVLVHLDYLTKLAEFRGETRSRLARGGPALVCALVMLSEVGAMDAFTAF